MPYIPFYELCPETAVEETRVITLLHKNNDFNLPIGEYAFLELFCDECNCRRVFLKVLLDQKEVATIAYGWGKLSFYRREFKGFDDKTIKDLQGPVLESFQYQSEIADRVFKMFKQILFADKEYVARIEKHYKQFNGKLRTINN